MTSNKLEDLFVRYWDNSLSQNEYRELQHILTNNPLELDRFRLLTLQAVAAGDFSGVVGSTTANPTVSRSTSTRRQILRYALGGAAATVAGGLAYGLFSNRFLSSIVLATSRGIVRVQSVDGQDISPLGRIPFGATIRTSGLNAFAVFTLPGGSTVTIAGDSAITVAPSGLGLVLQAGNATAQIRGDSGSVSRFSLCTSAATLTNLVEALVTVGHGFRETEVGVHEGQVTISSTTGESYGVIHEGQIMKVRVDGERETSPLRSTPSEFAWDLSVPLPTEWALGHREQLADAPAICPDLWFDPYHQSSMWQIRSDHQWASGFCKLHPDSVVRMRYRVDRPGLGEVVFCVREEQLPNSNTGVLATDKFLKTSPSTGEWQTWQASVAELREHRHAPKFGPPWIGFLAIVNTYKSDLGLKVVDFRVTRQGNHPDG